jgi:hypothetical protein
MVVAAPFCANAGFCVTLQTGAAVAVAGGVVAAVEQLIVPFASIVKPVVHAASV